MVFCQPFFLSSSVKWGVSGSILIKLTLAVLARTMSSSIASRNDESSLAWGPYGQKSRVLPLPRSRTAKKLQSLPDF